MTIVTASAGLSDAGRRRRHNEDAFVCEPPLFAIADGMGGAQAGELASRLAAASVGTADVGGLSGRDRIVAMIEEACLSPEALAKGGGKKDFLPMQPGDVRASLADISKAKKMLGFDPKTTIREGVPNFVEWYKNYYNK